MSDVMAGRTRTSQDHKRKAGMGQANEARDAPHQEGLQTTVSLTRTGRRLFPDD